MACRRCCSQSEREGNCEAVGLDIDIRDVEVSGIANFHVSLLALATGGVLEREPNVTANDDRRSDLVGGDVVQCAVE